MKAKSLNLYALKGFQFGTETHIIPPNPETTALYGDTHPSTPIVILQYFGWTPLFHKIVINSNALARPPSPYK